MRAFTAIILTLAAVATAAPSTGSDGVNVLQVRQECTYRCGCSTVNDIPGDTEGCCATAGGSYDGNVCLKLNLSPRYVMMWKQRNQLTLAANNAALQWLDHPES